ncbi:hypothetical protein T484DRAFT_1836623 [Baffinella frigidus]|nr:hypothetical protein T484DRAFT_1836623 [Cryptophyta sp. CCMP2293]
MRKGVYNLQTLRPYSPEPTTNTQAFDLSRLRRQPISAGARCGSGRDVRTPSFMPLPKSISWAGAMLPSVAWRKTKSPKAGAEEASYKQEMVQEVVEAPARKTAFRRFMNSVSENVAIGKVSTAARGAGDMLEPVRISQDEIPRPPPSSDPIATLNALPPRKLDAQTRSRARPAYRHRAKAAAKEGASARFLGRVHELRECEALTTNVASPKLHYSNYGMPGKKAERWRGSNGLRSLKPETSWTIASKTWVVTFRDAPAALISGDVTEKSMKVRGEDAKG